MDHQRSFTRRAPGRIPRGILAALVPVLFLAIPATLSAQATVQGSVTEAGGEPLVGAQVQVLGTNLGAVTDRDGRYQIAGVPTGPARMIALYLGFREATRSVDLTAGTNVVNFELAASPVELDAIVVTGTAGQVQRRSLGNAISTINAAEVLQKAPVTNLANLIQGRSAGTVVLNSSGAAGAGSAIRLRGLSSITQGNEPLIYIDGVRVDNDPNANAGVFTGGQLPSRINDIVPEDIESIEIIKGPAAATLYGTEAAAGVIQIITKKGRAGTTRWDLKGTAGKSDLTFNNDFPDNFGRVADLDALPQCPDSDIVPEDCGVRVVETLADGRVLIAQNPIELIEEQDLLDTLYQDYTLSASGGSDIFTFFASGNFKHIDGVVPNDRVQKIGGRANFQWTQSEIFDLSLSSGYTQNEYSLPQSDNNIFGIFTNLMLSTPVSIRPQTAVEPRLFGEPFAGFAGTRFIDADFTNDRFTGSVTANFNPFDWLRNRAIFGVDLNAEENIEFTPFRTVATNRLLGLKLNGRQTVFNVTFDYNGTATWDLTDDLQSNTSVGTQVFNENVDQVVALGEDFPAPGVSTVSAAGNTQGFEIREETTTVGVYFQEQIAWKNRLFLTGAVRFDDNSAFGEDFDFETYPKVSASYVISEEPWFASIPGVGEFVNTLKLRSAYGFAGKQPGAFDALRTFAPVSIKAGEAAITPGDLGNPDLGPERSREIEAGFDFGLWNDRLGGEVTYYNKVTDDALVNVPNIPSLGFPGGTLTNIGEVENKGWEFGLNALVLDTDVLDWDLTATAATNDNKINELGVEDFVIDFGQRVSEGFPLDGYFGRVIVGRDPESDAPIFSEVGDERFLGRSSPDFYGSFSSTVTLWDNLQLYGLIDWQEGNKLYSGTEEFRWLFFSVRELWDPALQEDQRFRDIMAFLDIGEETPFIHDASFVKLREVSASYTLPRDWAARIRADRVSLTASGRNLHTWTDFPGVDPEVSSTSQASIARHDFVAQPQTTLFLFTVNLSY